MIEARGFTLWQENRRRHLRPDRDPHLYPVHSIRKNCCTSSSTFSYLGTKWDEIPLIIVGDSGISFDLAFISITSEVFATR
jgi:hypothetical protein